MKNKDKLILGIILLAVMIVGASVLYNELKDEVEDNSFHIAEGEKKENADAAETDSVAAVDFTMTDKDGNEVKLSDFAGEPIVLNFWASWCGPCQMEMPHFEEAYKTYGEEVHFLMVNLTDGSRETVESALEFINDTGYTFPVYYDTGSEGAYTYGVYSIPVTYFINAEGNVVGGNTGMISAENLHKGIEAIR